MTARRTRSGALALFGIVLLSGCASGYYSFPISKAHGAMADQSVRSDVGGGWTLSAGTSVGEPTAMNPNLSTPAVLIDVLLLPFTAPVDLVLWASGNTAVKIANRIERSQHLSLAGQPVQAISEVLEALMLDPRHPQARSLLEVHVRRIGRDGDAAVHQAVIAASLGHYDALVADTDADDRHEPEFRERVAVIHGVVRDLAPDHPRLPELARDGG